MEVVKDNLVAFRTYVEQNKGSVYGSEAPYRAVLSGDMLVTYHSANDCGVVSVLGLQKRRVEAECRKLADSLGKIDNPEAVQNMLEAHRVTANVIYEERVRASKTALN